MTEEKNNHPKNEEDKPVTKMVALILKTAFNDSASDIHFKLQEDEIEVIFNINNTLEKVLVLPTKVWPALVARIKILANLDLDEKQNQQEGEFTSRIEEQEIICHVSTSPSEFDEKVTINLHKK